MFRRKDKGKKGEETTGGVSLKNGPPLPDYLPPQVEAKPEQVTIYLNGKAVRCTSGKTILEVCRENGVYIPTLCHHPLLVPTGRCGVCVVHIEGRNPPLQQSCKAHVEQDMVVTTNSADVLYQAQINLKEFLGMHALQDLGHTTEIEELSRYVAQSAVAHEENTSREYAVVRRQEHCIGCTRCVRACSGIQNMNILNINPDRPLQPISFEGDLPLHATSCIACGQCVAVCPTEAVSERNDVPLVLRELQRTGPERKILLIQTAPAARLSLGEMFGDEPGTSPKKTVAALHAAGFDYVFDTTFGADATAQLEAEELVERIRADGPWPMFTSCCPGWILLVEKKYPHLRKYVSRCKSPMMMVATMIRCWMRKRGIPRDRYYSVALMPCTAKKEEIARPDLRDPDGNQDIDVVLTVREMGQLLRSLGVDWPALPGKYSTDYDPPFASSSGGGALFPVSGGVTESALRVAYGLFTKEVPKDPSRTLYEDVRRQPKQPGEWVSSEVQVTPDRRHKRPIEAQVINGTRAIQQFLENAHLDTPDGTWTQNGNAFVECMACPGGCIGGGGQPRSLDPNILQRRRAAVHGIDAKSKNISATQTMRSFSYEEVCGIENADLFRELMECEPPEPPEPTHRLIRSTGDTTHPKRPSHHARSSDDDGGYDDDDNEGSAQSSSGQSSKTHSSRSAGGSFSANYLGNMTVLYGSQAGFTASFAKLLYHDLEHSLPDDVSMHPMDHFNFDLLKDCETVILLTSTWESDEGLMPQNAVRFWSWLRSQSLSTLSTLFTRVKFAVLGFGSQRYRHFCGFAVQLVDMFLRLGATQFLDLVKVDVDKPDRGKKAFTRWKRTLISTLQSPSVPDPRYLLVPSITPGGKTAPLSCPPGYQLATCTASMPYRHIPGAEDYYYIELDTGRHIVEPAPDQYVYILPMNDRTAVEELINTLYPGMLNVSISMLPAAGQKNREHGSSNFAASTGHQQILQQFPAHLTVRQLFERHLDLTRHPSFWFVQQLESLVESSGNAIGGPLADQLDDAQTFDAWARDKSYFDVLRLYREVVPAIEVLVSMLPPMLPRTYAPLHQENARPNALAFMCRRVANGLCSTYLTTLRKGDRVIFALGTTEFRRPNNDLMQPFYRALDAASRNSSKSGKSGSAVAGLSAASAAPRVVPMAEFPLRLSTTCLFKNIDRKPGVDEAVSETFEVMNNHKEKQRFSFPTVETQKFRLTFEPASGVIKPRYTVSVKATITVFCTCIIHTNAIVSSVSVSRRGKSKKKDSESAPGDELHGIDLSGVATELPMSVETKLSPKIDFDEIHFAKEIGSGTYGTVSRAEWRGQDVACKVIRGDSMSAEDFRNECNILQELRCQFIVNFIGYCMLPDRRALLTEFVELGSLSNYIHNPLSGPYRAKVALDIAKGMAFIHNCGLMHRDLKPGNILVVSLEPSQQVVVKIADFGVSRELPSGTLAPSSGSDNAKSPKTKTITCGVGTPIYMAPEILESKKYTTSADVYSYAVLLLELFSAKEPYDSANFALPWQIAQFVTAGNRIPIPQTVPREVADLIQRCWAHNPADRPSFEACADFFTKYDSAVTSDTSAGKKSKKSHDDKKSRTKEKHQTQTDSKKTTQKEKDSKPKESHRAKNAPSSSLSSSSSSSAEF